MYFNFTTDLAPNKGPPPTRAHLVLGVNSSLLALVIVIVTSRIFVKAKLGKLAFEDGLIVLSTFIIAVLIALTCFAMKYGFGMHVADIPMDWWPGHLKYSYAQIAVATTPYPLTKVSMLIFYIRLTQDSTHRLFCYATMAYVGVSAIVVVMLNLFGCSPISDGWNRSPGVRANCLNTRGYSYFYCSMSVLTDVMLMVLPIPILLRLKVEPRVKYGLVAMFAAGILVTSIGAFGVFAMHSAYISKDATSYSWMWGMIEMNMAIMVACMPSMLLFAKWFRGETNDTRRPHTGPRRGDRSTFGGGGGGGVKKNHSETTSELRTHDLVSEEYIMQGLGSQSAEVMVGMPPQSGGSDRSSMC